MISFDADYCSIGRDLDKHYGVVLVTPPQLWTGNSKG